MKFEIELQSLETPDLSIDYFKVPWDSELMSRQVAQIQRIQRRGNGYKCASFERFLDWMEANDIDFCTAKLPHASVVESHLLQAHGFQFMELNYRPEIHLEPDRFTLCDEFEFRTADITDRRVLCEMAFHVFRRTRFHLDPRLGEDIGNTRYSVWMNNAFERPEQQVVKCLQKSKIVGFFVLERPAPTAVFWSLVGLAPGLQGQGLASRIWPSALSWLNHQGTTTVSTSISSLNAPVVNLYVKLGFRFPEPEMTFHWHR